MVLSASATDFAGLDLRSVGVLPATGLEADEVATFHILSHIGDIEMENGQIG